MISPLNARERDNFTFNEIAQIKGSIIEGAPSAGATMFQRGFLVLP